MKALYSNCEDSDIEALLCGATIGQSAVTQSIHVFQIVITMEERGSIGRTRTPLPRADFGLSG
jgi:hypothetical protein